MYSFFEGKIHCKNLLWGDHTMTLCSAAFRNSVRWSFGDGRICKTYSKLCLELSTQVSTRVMSADPDQKKHKIEHHKVHRTSHSVWSSPIRAPSNSHEIYFGKESGGIPNWDKLHPHACILVPIHSANVHCFLKGIYAMQNLSRDDHTTTLVLCRLSKFGELMMLWSRKNIQDIYSGML